MAAPLGFDVVGIGLGVGFGFSRFAIGPGIGMGISPDGKLGSGYGIRAGLAVGPAISFRVLRIPLSIGFVVGPAAGYPLNAKQLAERIK